MRDDTEVAAWTGRDDRGRPRWNSTTMTTDSSSDASGHNQGEPPSCLLLHGLGGGIYEVAPVLEGLESAGVRVLAPTLPGHEGPGPIMPDSDWRDWARCVENAFDQLVAEGRPVTVVGFSTGATLALRLALSRPILRMALLAPFLAIRYSGWVPLRPASYLRTLAQVMPNLPRRPPAIRDPAARKQTAMLDRFTTFNLNTAISALDLIDTVKPQVPMIQTPTMILQGKLDTVVEPSDAQWLLRHLGSQQKALVWMNHSEHLIALDRDRQRVVELTRGLVLGVDASGNKILLS